MDIRVAPTLFKPDPNETSIREKFDKKIGKKLEKSCKKTKIIILPLLYIKKQI